MIGKRDITSTATENIAAIAALNKGGGSPAVKE